MRITFIAPTPNLSGGLRVIAIHADGLRKRGHEVTIVANGPYRPPLKTRVRQFLRSGRLHRPTRFNAENNHFDARGTPYRLLDRHRRLVAADVPDADAVIATWWSTAADVAALPPEKGRGFYFVQHHEVELSDEIRAVEASYRLPLHKITIANWLVETMASRYGDHDVDLVENSVDLDLFHAPPREKAPRPTAGYLYSEGAYKDPATMRATLDALRARVPDLAIVAFGQTPMPADHPHADITRFHLRPAQERIRSLYAECDVWICPSRSEGFHLPPLEACACRCPVVSTRVGGGVEAVTDGVNGFLVDVGDAEALAERAARVLTMDADTWRRFSDAARARAVQYSWDDASALFEAALERRIAGPPPSR